MNAAFCCASLGIVPTVRHADYIGSWLEMLREDNRAIVRAASQASKAADYILDMVAEVTGRSRRIVRKRDGVDRFAVEARAGSANLAETQAFMDDEKRILVFSDAGGTGRSYHANLAAKNQRLRVHYLLEAGWKADTAIQGLGHQGSGRLRGHGRGEDRGAFRGHASRFRACSCEFPRHAARKPQDGVVG